MQHEGQYKITSINPRAEAAGDDQRPAVDVDLENTVTAGSLREIFSDGQIDHLLNGLVDEAGLLRNIGVGQIKLDGIEIIEARVRIRTGLDDKHDVVFDDAAKVVKFRIKPTTAGMLTLHFQVQGHQKPGDLDKLTEALKEHCQVVISGEAALKQAKAQGSLDFDGEEDGPTGADDPLFDDAARMVLDAGQVYEEAIRKQFDIGWDRCSALLDAMADKGFITIPDDDGHREVILKDSA